MYYKFVHKKRLYMGFIILFLFVFQFFYTGHFSNERIFQFLIINVSLVSFIFAFHGFELDTLKSKNRIVISTAVGSFLGILMGMFFVILIFGAQRTIYRHELIATNIGSIVGIPFFSYIYYQIIVRKIPPTKCIVLGSASKYENLINEVVQSSHGMVRVHSWVDTIERAKESFEQITDETILIADLSLYWELESVVHILEKQGNQKFFITEVVEYWLYRIPLQLLDEYHDYYALFFNQTHLIQEKRIFDIFLGLIMMTISLPFILLFGLLIVLSSGFPIVFKQQRVGLYERSFMFYKLRSLVNDKSAEDSENPNGSIKQRITMIGKILRKTRIDEFPQFVNILNGTMSVVGPRPEMHVYHEKWKKEIPFYGYRNMVRPGLTGWAQINYGHTTTLEEYTRKTEYDLYYVKNKSLIFDIQIIMQTFETFLGMKGGK